MHFKRSLFFVFLFILTIISLSKSSFADNILSPSRIYEIFPDQKLAESVAKLLNKASTYENVTQNDLNHIKVLIKIGSKGEEDKISNLEGIQYLNNLICIRAARNRISDLNPLSNLKHLKEIQLPLNQICDLRPLEKLENLSMLVLNCNKIDNLEPLSELINIYWLDLSENQISNINSLEQLKNLEFLNLDDNLIVNIDLLFSFKKLANLYFRNNPIKKSDTLDLIIENVNKRHYEVNKIQYAKIWCSVC
jgi:internalin A